MNYFIKDSGSIKYPEYCYYSAHYSISLCPVSHHVETISQQCKMVEIIVLLASI